MPKQRSAFTLIELLVAVALLVILTGVVVWVFTRTVKLFITADARAQIYQNVRSGLDTIRRDIMTAEPIIAADNNSTGLQRLRIVNGTYNNDKWAQAYPADELQIWNLKSMLGTGQTGSCYAKYWLDHAANKTVPILKRKTSPVDTTAGSSWMTSNEPTTAGDAIEELMQYVVGLDIEPYYTNWIDGTAGAQSPDPYWTLDNDCNAGANQFKDNVGTPAGFFLVGWNPTTGVEDYTPLPAAWSGGTFNISSLVASGVVFPKRGAFSTGQPTSATTPANMRSVPALPRGLRFTFYVRDEHSNEQRAVQQVIWMPMWGS